MNAPTVTLILSMHALFFGSALAAEPYRIDVTDLIVDWPSLVGKRVVVLNGTIAGASADHALLKAPVGHIMLLPPWSSREDLRYLFRYCSVLLTDEHACQMTVIGDVNPSRISDQEPELDGVDFLIPVQ